MSLRHPLTHRLRLGVPLLALLLALTLSSHRGVVAQAGPTETLTFNPIADTYVDSSAATTNFNNAVSMKVDGSPFNIAYLRFAVSGANGRTVQQARLRLEVVGDSASGGTIHRITSNTWDPATVTYNTRPAVDGPGIQTLGAAAIGAIMEFNLDGVVTGDGTYNLAIDSTNSDSVYYNSTNATSGQKPTLVLTVAASPNPNVTIVQPPDGSSFFVGDQVTLQCTAIDDEDGNLGASVTWTSSLDGALGTGATITRTLTQGTHTVTAAVTDSDLLPGSDAITLIVSPPPPANTPPLVSITAPLDGRTFSSEQAIAFAGNASDLENGDLTAAMTWTSSRDGVIGTGGSFSRALSVGTHQITARAVDAGTLAGTDTISINVTAPVTLEFTPSADAYVDSGSATGNFGTSTQLNADSSPVLQSYLRFAIAGVGGRPVTKALLRLQVDTVSGSPSDVGGAISTVSNVTWAETGITYNTRPTVDGPTVASHPAAVVAGQVVDFDVTAAVTGDGSRSLALTTSSTNGVIYRSRESATPPKLILTLGGNPPTVAITAPANNAVIFNNAPVSFTATATDLEQGDLASQLQWTSNLDGNLGTGASVPSAALRIGTHTITATVNDNTGLNGQAQITVRVRGPNVAPTVTISAPADGTSVPAGTNLTFSGTATDDFDGTLTSQIQWTASPGGALGSGASVSATLAEGTHLITASVTDSDGVAGTAQISVLVTEEHITAFNWASTQEIDDMLAMTLRVNDFLSGLFSGVGITLVDFKIEFGRVWEGEFGRVILADEISPDSCRLWDSTTNEKLDKDRFRRDLGNVIESYTEVARRLGIMKEMPRVIEGGVA